MRINHNIAALNAYRQLRATNSMSNKSLEKLSSGLRINKAADDAAGLAISEKMRGQIRGLKQAQRNAQDAISLIQTAEGALSETHSILQRMRELAIQASNETNTSADREQIQKEVNQLIDELDRIAATTEFNTKKLLNGNIAAEAEITAAGGNLDSAELVDASLESGSYKVVIENVASVDIAAFSDGGTGITASDVTLSDTSVANFGSYRVDISDDPENDGKYLVEMYDIETGELVGSQSNVTDSATIEGVGISLTSGFSSTGSFTFKIEGDFDITLKDSSSATIASKTLDDYASDEVEIGGIKVTYNADIASANATVTVLSNAVQFQIGANENQTMNLAVNDMSAAALGVDDLDVTTVADAETAISALDDAIETVSTERSKLGAVQNRLEHTINNLGAAEENLTASESRIRDVDMAEEMMAFTKANILAQAGTAMLAQANQKPQLVLQLLG